MSGVKKAVSDVGDVAFDVNDCDDVAIDMEPIIITKISKVAPDGGFGWVVVVACFVISFFAAGYSKAFVGSVLNELSTVDKAGVEWVKASPNVLPLLLSPLCGLVLGCFGHRATFALGYFLCAVAMCVGFYSPPSHGVLARVLSLTLGSGLALGSCTMINCIKKYFVANRFAAMTVNAVGGILGGFASSDWVGSMVPAASFGCTWLTWCAVFSAIVLIGVFVFGKPEDHFISEMNEVLVDVTPHVSEEAVESVYQIVRFFTFVCKWTGLSCLADLQFILVLVICVGTTLGNTISTFSFEILDDEENPTNSSALLVTCGQIVASMSYGLMRRRRAPTSRKMDYLLSLVLSSLFVFLPYICGTYWQLVAIGVFGGIDHWCLVRATVLAIWMGF